MRSRSLLFFLWLGVSCAILAAVAQQPFGLSSQTSEEAARKGAGCTSAACHANAEQMHESQAVRLGCTDCHGGDGQTNDKRKAHVAASNRELFRTTANPVRAYAEWLRESSEYIRFINPGDLRVVDQTCGSSGCHEEIALNREKA
jgi:hypothetical protein